MTTNVDNVDMTERGRGEGPCAPAPRSQGPRGSHQSTARRLLLAAVGLAASVAGCVIDESGNRCQPYLTVPWTVVDNATNATISCSDASATTVEIDVNGVPFTQTCPTNATGGSVDILLDGSGRYAVDAYLLGGNNTLSDAHPDSFWVSCADTQTPTVTFPVNQQ